MLLFPYGDRLKRNVDRLQDGTVNTNASLQVTVL